MCGGWRQVRRKCVGQRVTMCDRRTADDRRKGLCQIVTCLSGPNSPRQILIQALTHSRHHEEWVVQGHQRGAGGGGRGCSEKKDVVYTYIHAADRQLRSVIHVVTDLGALGGLPSFILLLVTDGHDMVRQSVTDCASIPTGTGAPTGPAGPRLTPRPTHPRPRPMRLEPPHR